MRITYGRVYEPNEKKWSYCNYTNKINKSSPENWALKSNCIGIERKPWERIETNIILTSSDMIYGFSGAPLFNLEGEVLGVGSTVKIRYPGKYAPAIYSKSENLF